VCRSLDSRLLRGNDGRRYERIESLKRVLPEILFSVRCATLAHIVPRDLDQQSASDPALSVTLAPLVSDSSGDAIKAALDRIAAPPLRLRLRHVQISATMPGLRPRDLDRAARRDLLASLRRRELALSGLDAWIPLAHFSDPAHADRATQATCEIIELAADLARVPVSMILPADAAIAQALIDRAQHVGVEIADHALEPAKIEGAGVGIDPAAYLAQAKDPVPIVHAAGAAKRLTAARLCDLLTTGMRGPIATPEQLGGGGGGRLDATAYRIALDVNGYRRPVIIDARQWSEPWRGVEQTIAAWNDIAAP
jgi:sugar phosphate isomerase/epimerase